MSRTINQKVLQRVSMHVKLELIAISVKPYIYGFTLMPAEEECQSQIGLYSRGPFCHGDSQMRGVLILRNEVSSFAQFFL